MDAATRDTARARLGDAHARLAGEGGGDARPVRRLVDRPGDEQDERHDRDDDEPDPRHPACHVPTGSRMRRVRVGEVGPQLRGAL
jgi:hypothetical protein